MADACPREAVEAWAAALRREHPTVLFRAASACLPTNQADANLASSKGKSKGKGNGKARERADDAWGVDAIRALLAALAAEKTKGGEDAPLTVAVAGVANAGKTALVNALLGRAALRTYAPAAVAASDAPTTTAHPQAVAVEVAPGRAARVVDTPGLAWLPLEGADAAAASARARDILVRNRGRIERLKDPAPVCESAPFAAV